MEPSETAANTSLIVVSTYQAPALLQALVLPREAGAMDAAVLAALGWALG